VTIWLRKTKSTMLDAAALAMRGEAHGTVVAAEEQTEGIGRHGNAWHSPDNGGLYMSIILRLALTSDAMPVLTMALGLAVQRAVDEFCGVACDIRWPNDVMLSGKKLAGILVQMADKGALIGGIGVNVGQPSFPDALSGIATSLLIETGRVVPKEELLERIVAEVLRYAGLLSERGKAEIIRRFEERSTWARGKAVEVDGRIRGVTAGLNENGFLLVETGSGTETILAGGVRAV
jgi:BirA family biotin operon repressor/biotin-[acetyl-CoA-carboxylase] ligase